MTDASYGETHGGGDLLAALFDTRSEADAAVARLTEKGVPPASIQLIGGATESESERLTGWGAYMPEEDRHVFEEGIRRGGHLLVVVDPPRNMRDDFSEIMEGSGAVNLDEREQQWREQGWTGYSAARAEAGFAEGQSRFAGASEETVPVVEENLRVSKRDRGQGRVRVRSYVREEPVSADVELRDERVEVERRPADRPAGEGAFQERDIELEEHAEEPVVRKEARVVEEVGLRKESESRRETVTDTVRRTDVDVERDDGSERR